MNNITVGKVPSKLDLLIGKVRKFLNGNHPEPKLISVFHRDVFITTNVGTKLYALKCELKEYVIHKRDITLFERFILRKHNKFYRINCIPDKPIRQNRDKEYLGSFSEEGNDATHEFSFVYSVNEKNPDLSIWKLNSAVAEAVESIFHGGRGRTSGTYPPAPWTRRVIWSKQFNSYKENIAISTAIYPFTGSDLSGYTKIFKLELGFNESFRIIITLLGFNLQLSSGSLYEFLIKNVLKIERVPWIREDYQEWKRLKKIWVKEHPVWNFFDVDKHFEIGLSRADGLYLRLRSGEFAGVDNWSKKYSINLLRNIFWNLI